MSDGVPLDSGGCYLLQEQRPDASYRLFSAHTGMKKAGLVVTRQYPDIVREKRTLHDARIIWLSHTEGEESHNPAALDALAEVVQRFIEEHKGAAVILLEGLEYLVLVDGFPRTLRFVERVNELATRGAAIVLMPVDARAVGDSDLAALRRVVKILAPPTSRTAVRLIPDRPDLVPECQDLLRRLHAASDVDDGPRPVEEKIREAQRSRIPFIVLMSAGDSRSRVLHVLHYRDGEKWMSPESLQGAIKDWQASGE